MKTQKLFSTIILAGFILLFSNCSNDLNSIPGKLNLKATAFSHSQLMKVKSLLGDSITITSAMVQIQNLVIEENTGENDSIDNNSENENKNESKENENESEKGDVGDVKLAGPFVLDIFTGAVIFENVELQPGTYKKVDFNFLPSSGVDNHSIVIGGNYKKNGLNIPFTIVADLSSEIQLPLTGAGLTIATGATSSLSVVFDLNMWLSKIDWLTATVTDGKITISNTENKKLYDVFVNGLTDDIDVEENHED